MNARPLSFLSLLFAGAALAQNVEPAPTPSTATPNPALKGYDAGGGAGKRIHIVPIEGMIDGGLASFVQRVVEGAEPNDVILLTIKTDGGRVDSGVQIFEALMSSQVPTVAYVDGRAISAGALIALACDTIIMGPAGTIGDAMPVYMDQEQGVKPAGEKAVTYMRAKMRAAAEAKGRPIEIIEAMVDPDIEIKDVIEKGKLLTLTRSEAIKLKVVEGSAENMEGAVALLNLGQATRIHNETHWGEKVTRFITDPMISGLLMTIGLLGLMIELYTPGFGWAGGIGLGCLGTFFFGQYAAQMAGWEEAILITVGLVLLALEIFVIPGFGVTGIAGIVAVVVGLLMALVEVRLPWDVSFELGYLQEAASDAAIHLAVVLVVLVAGGAALAKYVPTSKLARWLVFRVDKDGAAALGAEAHGGSLPTEFDELLGAHGTTYTVLRPTGVVEFAGKRVHVLTEGEFVDKGVAVKVIEVDGHRVVVRAVDSQG